MKQPVFDLFEEEEEPRGLTPAQEKLSFLDSPPTRSEQLESSISRRSLLLEQVMRDRRVLDEEDWYHVPSTDFFVDRIVANLKELEKLR
jgi:hypothetical protein